ncbi:hypothetical protein CVT26_012373 [Gymnopilus dilepis]|uniref:Uncharacterized protein n=1 Tax=Gymnopilus dilepis TaxID=231916 RepID=A0A409WAP9_9AGAR|nr:hypothetical protein CVT26_012373 [Gymnopilus dilepis]
MTSESSLEPILSLEPKRLSLFPIEHHAIWRLYQRVSHTSHVWTADSVDLSSDANAWQVEAPFASRELITFFLDLLMHGHKRMFGDLLLAVRKKIPSPEARCVIDHILARQVILHITHGSLWLKASSREDVHAAALNRLKTAYLDETPLSPDPAFVFDDDDLESFLEEKFKFTFVSPSANIEDTPVAEFLLVLAAAKRVFSFSLFSMLKWIVDCKDLALPALSRTIQRIQDDVETHLDFAVLLLAHLNSKPSQDLVLQAVTQAMQIEDRFAMKVMSLVDVGPEEWISRESMKDYTGFLAKTLMETLGHRYWTYAYNPFPWMNHSDGSAAAYWLEVSMENPYEEEPEGIIRRPGLLLHPPDGPFQSYSSADLKTSSDADVDIDVDEDSDGEL